MIKSKSKLAEAASEHIKHKITDGYEEDLTRQEEYLKFLDELIKLTVQNRKMCKFDLG